MSDMEAMPRYYRGENRRRVNLHVLSNDRAPFTLSFKRLHIPIPRPATCLWLIGSAGALIAYAVMR